MSNVETNTLISQGYNSYVNPIMTSTSSQINPTLKTWAKLVQHASNSHIKLTNDEWNIFFSHLQTVANTDCSSFFAHDEKLSGDIQTLQKNLKTIITILDKATELHEKKFSSEVSQQESYIKIKASLEALQKELGVEIKEANNIINKLYEPHGGNKLIYNKRSKESNNSKLFNTTVILTVASILLSVALFALPLAFPAMLITGATVLTILRGISALISCVSGSLAIYEGIKKGEYKSTKLQEREFTETLSALHNYLNKLNFLHITDETVNSPDLLRDNTSILQDKEAKGRLLPPEIQQLLNIPEIQNLLKIIQQRHNSPYPDILENAYSA